MRLMHRSPGHSRCALRGNQRKPGVKNSRTRGASLLVALGLCAVLTRGAVGQEMSVPVPTQVSFLTRILAFDRNLDRMGEEIVVGVLYQPRFRASLNAKNAVLAAGHEHPWILDLPVRYVAAEMADSAQLHRELVRHGVDVVYVAPLRAVAVEDVVAVCRALRLLSFTGMPVYLRRGLVMAVGSRGKRPVMLVNLGAARAFGAELSSELLKLAQIVGGR